VELSSKREKELVEGMRNSLKEQCLLCEDEKVCLQLVSLVLFSQRTGGMLHFPGSRVAVLVNALKELYASRVGDVLGLSLECGGVDVSELRALMNI
jgi:hypothetical protein